MSCLGTGELLTLTIALLIIFAASRPGKVGNAIGRFVYNFKRAAHGQDTIDVTPTKKTELPPSGPGNDGRHS